MSKYYGESLTMFLYFYIYRNMEQKFKSDEYEQEATAFAALGSTARLVLMRALVRAGRKGLSIGEIGARCGLSGANLSHHIRILDKAGLLVRRKDGRRIICVGAFYPTIRKLSAFLHKECCVDAGDEECTHKLLPYEDDR